MNASAAVRSPFPDTQDGEHGNSRYADIRALLAGGLPDPPAPVLLHREDGHALFYAGQVNLLFGDPESGKTLVAQAAAAEALQDGRRVLFVDIDHNGVQAIVYRFLDLGVSEDVLADQELFRYVEPEDRMHLADVVADSREWRPAVAVVDSIGELLPLLGLSSNSPDEFTNAHARVLKPLAIAGAAVIAIDHLPKNSETRASGPTGTAAKRRAIGGVSLRVTVNEQFTPGKGGSAFLTVNKDRHGGLRQHCPSIGREPAAGVFKLDSSGYDMKWSIRAPELGDSAKAAGVSKEDLAALDALVPLPKSVRDVRERMHWRTDRAADVLREWRSQRSQGVPGKQETDPADQRSPFPTLCVGEQETAREDQP